MVEGESLKEGSVVTVLVSDERTFTLSKEEETALLEAIAKADEGNLVDAQGVLNYRVRASQIEVLALWHSSQSKRPSL